MIVRLLLLVIVVAAALALCVGLIVGVGTTRVSLADLDAGPRPAASAKEARATPPMAAAALTGTANATPPTASGAPAAADEGKGSVISLTVVRAENASAIKQLADGATLDLGSLPTQRITLRADVAGRVKSVRFHWDGSKRDHIEETAPYTILGGKNGKYERWKISPGEHTVTATPFAGPQASGEMGQPLTVHFTVTDDGPIILPATAATIHGQELHIQKEGDLEPNVGFWTNEVESIEWFLEPGRAGLYRVECDYACADGQGGVFECIVGEHRFTATSTPTGAWQQYRALKVGELTLPARKIRLLIKPLHLEAGHALMNLRAVRIVPVRE